MIKILLIKWVIFSFYIKNNKIPSIIFSLRYVYVMLFFALKYDMVNYFINKSSAESKNISYNANNSNSIVDNSFN